MKNVSNKTRAPKRGMDIYCPHCNSLFTVNHFNWITALCPQCNVRLKKTDFLFDDELLIIAKSCRHFLVGIMTSDDIEGLIQRAPKKSIVSAAKKAIWNMTDFDLAQLFITTCPTCTTYKNIGDMQDSELLMGLKSIVSYFYENEESKDIAELRKQKLLRIEHS